MFRCSAADAAEPDDEPDTHKKAAAAASAQPGALRALALLEPQAGCLTTPSGGWAVDFLVRAEPQHVLDDLREAVELANRRAAEGGSAEASGLAVDEQLVLRHVGGLPDAGRVVAMYTKCGELCRAGVAAAYKADLERLGVV